MKKLHKLKVAHGFYAIVFETNSPSAYNRFLVIVREGNEKEFLVALTMKTDEKSEYKKQGIKLFNSYNNRKIS